MGDLDTEPLDDVETVAHIEPAKDIVFANTLTLAQAVLLRLVEIVTVCELLREGGPEKDLDNVGLLDNVELLVTELLLV